MNFSSIIALILVFSQSIRLQNGFDFFHPALFLIFPVLLYALQIKLKIDRDYFYSLIILVFLSIYISFVGSLTHQPSWFEVFRTLRACVSSLLIYFILRASHITHHKVINSISILCYLHLICVILQLNNSFALSFLTKLLMPIEDVHKLSSHRAFGIAGSYDTAGAVFLIGIILNAYQYKYKKNNLAIMNMLLFFLGGIQTGRTFLVFGILFFLILSYQTLKSRSCLNKISFSLALTPIFYFIITSKKMDLLLASLNYTLYQETPTDWEHKGLYIGSLSLLIQMVHLPDTLVKLIFGSGQTWPSDIGYVKILHTTGVIGSLIYLIYYKLLHNQVRHIPSLEKKWIYFPTLLWLILYNLKLPTLLSSFYHEIYLIIILSLRNRNTA